MFVSLALLVVVVAAVVVAIRLAAVRAARSGGTARPPVLRALFMYVLLFAAVIVSGVGAAGFLGRWLAGLGGEDTLVGGSVEAARNGAFLVVGLPVLALLGWRTLRAVRADPVEEATTVWAGYMAAASVTSLVLAMTALHDSLVWAFNVGPDDPRAVGRAVVWTLVWFAHWHLDRTLTPRGWTAPHLLLGSAIGLVTTCFGVVGLIGNGADIVLGLRFDTFTRPEDQILRAVATALVGGAVWALYWWGGAVHWWDNPVHGFHDILHRGYALVAGPVAGTAAAVVGTAWVLSDVLVQLLGDPAATATLQFHRTPHLVAVALVGAGLFGYHVRLLGPGPDVAHGRTNWQRLRDYAVALLGLVATATGGTMLVVALVDAVTSSVTVNAQAPVNLALSAAAVLVTGVPVFWAGYRAAAAAVRADGDVERASVPRRTYLLGLTFAATLVGFGSLVATVYLWFEDLFAGDVTLSTLKAMRFALGLLAVAAAVAGTHGYLVRTEKSLHPRTAARAVPRSVLLVGPADHDLARAVATATGASVVTWPRTDGVEPAWPVADVVRAVESAGGRDVVVVRGPDAFVAVPVARAGTTRATAPAADGHAVGV